MVKKRVTNDRGHKAIVGAKLFLCAHDILDYASYSIGVPQKCDRASVGAFDLSRLCAAVVVKPLTPAPAGYRLISVSSNKFIRAVDIWCHLADGGCAKG